MRCRDEERRVLHIIKIIAAVLMLIDHIGNFLIIDLIGTGKFYTLYIILRLIGRLSMPLFAYSIAVGFVKTRNRNKYFARILIFAFLTQLMFFAVNAGLNNFSFSGVSINEPYINILFTFFLSLIVLTCIERFFSTENDYSGFIIRFFCAVSAIICILTAEMINSDYSSYGILTVVVFYASLKIKKPLMMKGLQFALFALLNFAYILIAMYNGKDTFSPVFQSFSILSLVILWIPWNDLKVKIPRMTFYIYYPVHIAILMIIAHFI